MALNGVGWATWPTLAAALLIGLTMPGGPTPVDARLLARLGRVRLVVRHGHLVVAASAFARVLVSPVGHERWDDRVVCGTKEPARSGVCLGCAEAVCQKRGTDG